MIKNLSANAGDTRDTGSILGSGRSPGVGNGNPLQYSCLENPKDRGAWWVIDHQFAKSWTRLSLYARARAHTHTHTHTQQYHFIISAFSMLHLVWMTTPASCLCSPALLQHLPSWNTSLHTFYSGGAPHCLLIKPSLLRWYSGSTKNGDLCYIPVPWGSCVSHFPLVLHTLIFSFLSSG